jgi:TatD DNase family protein
MRWIDSHNHLQFLPLDEVAEVLAAMAAVGIGQSVVNATSEADWEAVADLARRWPERVVPSFGIHPWQAGILADGWRDRLRELLLEFPQAGVGECGLDRGRNCPPMAQQRAVFDAQLRLGWSLGRTVTIHCGGAWGELVDALTTVGVAGKFLLHAYAGSLELARRLVPLGAYFSFSPLLWEGGRTRPIEVFRQLPLDRLLIESDAPQRPQQTAADGRSPMLLPTTGQILADALGIRATELAELTRANAMVCCSGLT